MGGSADTSIVALKAAFDRQQRAVLADPHPSLATRRRRLQALERLLVAHQHALASAIHEDFGTRCHEETRSLEVLPVVLATRRARRSLGRWMRSRRVRPLWCTLPASGRIVHEPLGVVGIVAPWNYPLLLALGPLVGALAAGNRVLLKVSEFVPATADLLERLVADVFDPSELAVLQGGPDVGQAFASLPFDHLCFTGSTDVGRQVLRSAAENLTPVTLELGGKCPAVVAPDAAWPFAVENLWHGKLLNAGQSCVAPDHVYVPQSRLDAFVQQSRATVARMYPSFADNPEYTAIISDAHMARLTSLIDDARAHGARVLPLDSAGEETLGRKFVPTLVLDVNASMRVMNEEIFGPVLPVVAYDTIDDVRSQLAEARPSMATIVYSERSATVEALRRASRSGSMTINSTLVHFGQDGLPLGGLGPSGMGRYHGYAGFQTFSNVRSIYHQHRPNALGLAFPPRVSALKRRVLDWLIGYG